LVIQNAVDRANVDRIVSCKSLQLLSSSLLVLPPSLSLSLSLSLPLFHPFIIIYYIVIIAAVDAVIKQAYGHISEALLGKSCGPVDRATYIATAYLLFEAFCTGIIETEREGDRERVTEREGDRERG